MISTSVCDSVMAALASCHGACILPRSIIAQLALLFEAMYVFTVRLGDTTLVGTCPLMPNKPVVSQKAGGERVATAYVLSLTAMLDTQPGELGRDVRLQLGAGGRL